MRCSTLTLACKELEHGHALPKSRHAAANVAGTWTGTFQSDSSACASSQITATFQQSGAQVTGTLSGTSCGSSGAFKGTVSGNQLTGSIEMLGCSGGAVIGDRQRIGPVPDAWATSPGRSCPETKS